MPGLSRLSARASHSGSAPAVALAALLFSAAPVPASAHDDAKRLDAGRCAIVSEQIARELAWHGPCRDGLAHGKGVMLLDGNQAHRQTYQRGRRVGKDRDLVVRRDDGSYFRLRCTWPCTGVLPQDIAQDEVPSWARPYVVPGAARR